MSGYDAYQQRNRSALNPKNVEAEAFLEAARRLEEAARTPTNRRKVAKALHFVRRLWTIVQGDLMAPSNPLPDDFKADVLSLSLYMDKETVKQNCNPSAEGLQSLCLMHRNIASGLRAK